MIRLVTGTWPIEVGNLWKFIHIIPDQDFRDVSLLKPVLLWPGSAAAAAAIAVVVVAVMIIVVNEAWVALIIIVAKTNKINREKILGKKPSWGAYSQRMWMWQCCSGCCSCSCSSCGWCGCGCGCGCGEAEMAKTSREEMKLRVYSSMLQGAVTQGSSPSSPWLESQSWTWQYVMWLIVALSCHPTSTWISLYRCLHQSLPPTTSAFNYNHLLPLSTAASHWNYSSAGNQ